MKNKIYDDFRCCELKTQVKRVIEENGFYWHEFDNTIFYADENYNDVGMINQYPVLKLKEEKGVMYHLLDVKLSNEVLMVLDVRRRYCHAQNATLSLLMDQMMSSVYHAQCVSHRICDFVMISSYEGAMLTPTQKNELQISLNGMIRDDYQVNITYEKISGERYVQVGLFSSVKSTQIVVGSLKFIQMVDVLKVVETKNGFQIVTTCGDQMLLAMDTYSTILEDAAKSLCCEPLYLNSAIQQLLNKQKAIENDKASDII